MKKISTRTFAAIKRVAQNVNPLVTKKNKNIEKMEKLNAENMELEQEILGHEAGIKALTGGYTSEDLVKKVTEVYKVDEDGKEYKATKYVPTDLIVFNEEENCYYIKDEEFTEVNQEEVDDAEKAPEVETTDWMANKGVENPFNEEDKEEISFV